MPFRRLSFALFVPHAFNAPVNFLQAVLAAVDANTTLRDFSAYNNGAVDKATRKRLRGFKNGERKAA